MPWCLRERQSRLRDCLVRSGVAIVLVELDVLELRWRYGRDRLVVDVGPHVVLGTSVAAGIRRRMTRRDRG
jgi:hypothetical protein